MSAVLVSTSNKSYLDTKTGAAIVAGHHTDIAVTIFQDKNFIVLTQYEKLGTLVLVTKDIALDDPSGNPTYTTKVLLGKDDEVIHVVARNLADKIRTPKAVLFSLALKDTSPLAVRELGDFLLGYVNADNKDKP